MFKSALFLIAALSLISPVALGSNCPTPLPLLQSGVKNRLIADVTVVANVPSSIPGQPDSAIVDVSAIYAGYAPNRIVVDSFFTSSLGGCGSYVGGFDAGTRLIISVTQNPQTGRYGGSWQENFAPVVEGRVEGYIEPGCPSGGNSNCFDVPGSRTLEDFETTIAVLHPGGFLQKQRLESDFTVIALGDGLATIGSELSLDFETTGCDIWRPNTVRIDDEQRTIDFSYYQFRNGDHDFMIVSPCFRESKTFPLGRLYREGVYQLRVYEEAAGPEFNVFRPDRLIGQMTIPVIEPMERASPETPAAGSTQSGIGLIRGWACDARSVMVQFDNLPPIELAYGAVRMDTVSVCGDANNGYGAVFAWGSLGAGMHRMRTRINGELVGDVEFEVRGLGSAFVEGLSGEYPLEGFPQDDEGVVVRWSQADQNFVIVSRHD